jgi:hypothetical protein
MGVTVARISSIDADGLMGVGFPVQSPSLTIGSRRGKVGFLDVSASVVDFSFDFDAISERVFDLVFDDDGSASLRLPLSVRVVGVCCGTGLGSATSFILGLTLVSTTSNSFSPRPSKP